MNDASVNAIAVKGLTKRFGKVKAVADASFEVLKGKLFGFLGPNGAGKTTLVSEWLHQQQRSPAWLSLDANDSEPQRFARYLVAALNEVDITLDRNLAGQWQTPERPSAESLVVELINDVVANLPPFVLVLDDYHLISDPAIHKGLAFLLEHMPPQMHVAISTRADPPLPIHRLRARGQLTELRSDDLRFSAGEATAFLNATMGLDLTAEDVKALEARTEGWIVGLQMALHAVKDKEDADWLVANLKGDLPEVAEFLVNVSKKKAK